LTRSLLVQATEVTRWQWQEIFPEEAPWRNDECGLDCPVEEITWYQAVAYCNERSLLEGLEPCYEDEESGEIYSASSAEWWVTPSWPLGLDCEGYRLPTEAEWEYFARAGSPGAYPTGGTQVDLAAGCETLDPPLDRVAWYCGNAGGLVHPVAEKEPNAWGLFDVLGNVGELCWDGFDPTAVFGHQPVTDPLGPRIASYQVQRGGSYLKLARTTRLARREGVEPDFISPDRGFRPVRTLTD